MASTRTRTDLIKKVLEKLGVAASGQEPEIEDTARVDANLDSVVAEFPALEVVDIPDVNAIPDEYFLSIASVIAYELRDEFGIIGDALTDLTAKNAQSIEKLRFMTRGRPTYQSNYNNL